MLARLEDAFRRLSDFSSDLAHELRTPISNLMTQTQVALSQPRDAATYLEVLGSNAEEFERLARTISDMLFLAKADHGLMLPSRENIVIEQEIGLLFDFYEALAAERGIDLELSGSGQLDGDRLMLRRALSNLLSNALRHAPDGSGVAVRIERSASEVVVTVENQGETIAEAHLPHLFERFYRADGARVYHPAEGAGLGLPIARAIATAHHGSVSVESSEGITRFSLRFPTPA
jgi:two-component system, OmpR family, heavy metal sensor histidine kinase CusS